MTAVSSTSERLQHSHAGLFRLSQLARATVHVYVEGAIADPYYYSKVLESLPKPIGIEIEIHLSREISGTGEGKQRCISFYRELFDSENLVSRLEGKKTAHFFFLDKDIDEIEGLQIQSSHLCYTSHYCVENHIVKESDVAGALAAALGMDIKTIRILIKNQGPWLRNCFDLWQDWILICIMSKISGCGIANYKRLSQVNNPATYRYHHSCSTAL